MAEEHDGNICGEKMRVGVNPNKGGVKIDFGNRPTVLVVTYLPDLAIPYHAKRREVIKKSLYSLLNSTTETDYTLIVWDNGSCAETREFLASLPIDRLVLSDNIGRGNAIKSVMRMCPPGSVLACADDDMEYYPGWLTASIEILTTYPNVGAVTGYPTRGQDWPNTKAWAQQNADVKMGKFIPENWQREHASSLGMEWGAYKNAVSNYNDYKITYKGVSSYAISHHCQFVCYPERVEKFIEWSDLAMPPFGYFDEAIEAAGLLQLCTTKRYSRHLGNVV
jgi:glycosyltransferase involved in cell wall biosynthesis